MAKKSNKAAGVAVAVGGVAALGLAAYALSQSKGGGQKEASQLLSSGGYGGGATGGYSDAFTDVITPNAQPTTPQPSITDTVADVLNKVVQTPQAQPPIFVLGGNDDTAEPSIPDLLNPSDERSDTKTELPPFTPQTYKEAELLQQISDWKPTLSQVGGTSQSTNAYEYSPFDFAPTPKQADYSSYNAGKTGGNTAPQTSSPAKGTAASDYEKTGTITMDGKTYTTTDKKPTSPSTSNNVVSTVGKALGVSNPVLGGVVTAAGSAFSSAASAVGSFFSGLFGGK